MAKRLRPLGKQVVVRRDAPRRQGEDDSREKPNTGTVLAVGPEAKKAGAPDSLQVGETVLIVQYAGIPVVVDGEELFIASSDDILAIVEDDE